MGKATKWFRNLLGLKKPSPTTTTKPPPKRRWSFVKSTTSHHRTPSHSNSPLPPRFHANHENDQQHAIAVAQATAAVANASVAVSNAAVAVSNAAIAAAQRAAEVVKLTSGDDTFKGEEYWAAVTIQSHFRAYLVGKKCDLFTLEAFSLLKYWRGSGASSTGATAENSTTIDSTSFIRNVIGENEAIESDEEANTDDGPFFDMEFTLDGVDKVKNEENEGELKFTLSSASSGDSIDPNISLSPSDDLFFKGRLVPEADTDPDTNSNAKPVSKSQKLRVLMLKLKKSSKLSAVKGGENEDNVVEDVKCVPDKAETKQQTKQSAKFFTVKFKVEEVPVLSMFTRDNSLKIANTKTSKENVEKSTIIEEEEKVFSKDMVNKYLKKVKSLYVRVSKRYSEKLGFSGHLSLAGAMKSGTGTPKVSELSQVKSQGDSSQVKAGTGTPRVSEFSRVKSQGDSSQAGTGTARVSELSQGDSSQVKAGTGTPRVSELSQGDSTQMRCVKSLKQGISFPGKLRVVRKLLGKSKSALSTVTSAVDSPSVVMVAKRRDDSLLQQQDGIQSAILHCKRSFKASRELEGKGGNRGNEKVATGDLSCSVDKAKGDKH